MPRVSCAPGASNAFSSTEVSAGMLPSVFDGGVRPGTKPLPNKRCSSAASSLTTCTGTSQLATRPLTKAGGWWSPTTIMTRGRGVGRRRWSAIHACW